MVKKQKQKGHDSAPSFAIRLTDVNKSFGPVRANRNINLEVKAGTIHGIVGENGAGKSTLMNIIYGLHTADSGKFEIFGEPASIKSSADAIALGVGMVHQHFMLVPNMSVLDNVMLGTEGGFTLREGREKTLQILDHLANEYAMQVDADAIIEDLPVGIRQRVEIIKAIKGGARILILDEPTGVLTPGEAKQLFEILRSLRDDGVTVLLITHKLEEIVAVTDAVSVMRDGEMIAHRKTQETSPEELARLMVGRDVLLEVDKGEATPGEVVMKLVGLCCNNANGRPVIDNLNFELRAGEILGVAGVAGNGQTELLEVLSGMRKPDKGELVHHGQSINANNDKTPLEFRAMGVAHIPEDRHKHALVMSFEAAENAVLGQLNQTTYSTGLLINHGAIKERCATLMADHDVRPSRPDLLAKNFSGGNQQKLVIGREVDTKPEVLIVGQPTRGVDIGAIEFIHKELVSLRDNGCAILLVSVELSEILNLSDRVLVMNEGRSMGIVEGDDINEETIGMMMAGIERDAAA